MTTIMMTMRMLTPICSHFGFRPTLLEFADTLLADFQTQPAGMSAFEGVANDLVVPIKVWWEERGTKLHQPTTVGVGRMSTERKFTHRSTYSEGQESYMLRVCTLENFR